jgi:hypothetical protein
MATSATRRSREVEDRVAMNIEVGKFTPLVAPVVSLALPFAAY